MTSTGPPAPPWDQRLARRLVRPLAKTPITPNQVTTASLLLGVSGGVLLGFGGAAAGWGALCYMLAQFVDHMDGELARLTERTSTFGHFYDHVAGGIFEVTLFLGIGIGLRDSVLADWAPVLGVIAAVSVGVTVSLRAEMSRRFGNDSIAQPSWAGFEIEDIMYLVGPITWAGGLMPFLLLAAVGMPVYMVMTIVDFFRQGRLRDDAGSAA